MRTSVALPAAVSAVPGKYEAPGTVLFGVNVPFPEVVHSTLPVPIREPFNCTLPLPAQTDVSFPADAVTSLTMVTVMESVTEEHVPEPDVIRKS